MFKSQYETNTDWKFENLDFFILKASFSEFSFPFSQNFPVKKRLELVPYVWFQELLLCAGLSLVLSHVWIL